MARLCPQVKVVQKQNKKGTSALRFMYIREIIGLGVLKLVVVRPNMGTVSFFTKLEHLGSLRISRLSCHSFSTSRNPILCLQWNCNQLEGIHEEIQKNDEQH